MASSSTSASQWDPHNASNDEDVDEQYDEEEESASDDEDITRESHELASSSIDLPLQQRNRALRRLQGRNSQARDARAPLSQVFAEPRSADEPADDEEGPPLVNEDIATALGELPRKIDFATIPDQYPGWRDSPWVYELRHRGYKGVIDKLWDNLVAVNHYFTRRISKKFFSGVTLRILATTPPILLIHLMLGTLHKVIEADEELKAIPQLLTLCTDAVQLPVIYWQTLLHDATKVSLTWDQLLTLCNNIDRYLNDNSFAFHVDTLLNTLWTQDKSNAGRRWYLAKRSERKAGGTYEIDQNHVNKMQDFVMHVRARVAKIPVDRHHEESIPPISEFGWTMVPHKRLRQHKTHATSANVVLCLCEAILRATGTGFRIQQHIIYVAWEPAQGIIAEPIFTDLGHGQVREGTGCNTYEAGRNNPVDDVEEDLWAMLKKEITYAILRSMGNEPPQ
jgi:hypothetical protein